MLALRESEKILRMTLLSLRKAIQSPWTGRSTQQGKDDGINLEGLKGTQTKVEEYGTRKKEKALTVASHIQGYASGKRLCPPR